jgi:hypothetical protein
MNLLLETNVVLDVLLRRPDWLADAEIIWKASEDGRLSSSISASSITDLYYISRRLVGAERARQVVRDCLDVIGIIGVTGALLEAAYALEGVDFEDDLQVACAMSVPLDAIVTRDPAGFATSPIPAFTPAQLIAQLNESPPSDV